MSTVHLVRLYSRALQRLMRRIRARDNQALVDEAARLANALHDRVQERRRGTSL